MAIASMMACARRDFRSDYTLAAQPVAITRRRLQLFPVQGLRGNGEARQSAVFSSS
jgi:hypothetical protein